jgi:hypothetical protein
MYIKIKNNQFEYKIIYKLEQKIKIKNKNCIQMGKR